MHIVHFLCFFLLFSGFLVRWIFFGFRFHFFLFYPPNPLHADKKKKRGGRGREKEMNCEMGTMLCYTMLWYILVI